MGIKRIAKLANVSIGTVDRVLHKRSGVSKETEKKVLKIIEEIGYSKNTTASRLKLASVKKIRIAILIPSGKNKWSYWKLPKKGVLKAIEELTELGVVADFYDFSNALTFTSQCNNIFQENFDAIITVPFFKEASKILLNHAESINIPVVFLDTEIELEGTTNFIRQNAFKAGMVAGRLLYGLVGNKGQYFIVNMIIDGDLHASGKQREDGFRAFFKSNSKGLNIQTINQPMDVDFKLTKQLESKIKNNAANGIFVTNSRSHIIPPILKKQNIKNTKVVGFDVNKKNIKCLKDGDINFIIDQDPNYQGYAAIKGLYKYLTEQDSSELNRDISIGIIVKENLPEL